MFNVPVGGSIKFEYSVPLAITNQYGQISTYSSSSPWSTVPTVRTLSGNNYNYVSTLSSSAKQIIFVATGTHTNGLVQTGRDNQSKSNMSHFLVLITLIGLFSGSLYILKFRK